MRVSMCVHVESLVHEYRQKPPTHDWLPLQADLSESEQIGFGRVSGTHAPSLQ